MAFCGEKLAHFSNEMQHEATAQTVQIVRQAGSDKVANPLGDALNIAMVAGEASGDLLASWLLQQLAKRLPAESTYFGIGGAKMQQAGFDARWPAEKLSVRGYVEALRHIPEILRIRSALKRQLLFTPPTAFIGIDAPDFNLALEVSLRRAGIPTIHFISPSIWAWRSHRIQQIADAVDLMLCVFPFETAIYKQAGINACYVGHPLADNIPLAPDMGRARQQLSLPAEAPIVAVLPGSRYAEIKLIAPTFFQAIELMQKREPALHFVLPTASKAIRTQLQSMLPAYSHLQPALTVTEGKSHTAIEASNAVLVASGTAALEAALYKKPMVISYKVPWLTAQIMKRKRKLPYIGLPNILAGRSVVPELLLQNATPDALANAMLHQLNDETNQQTLIEIFTQLHHTLKCNAAERAADAIFTLLND